MKNKEITNGITTYWLILISKNKTKNTHYPQVPKQH